MGDVANTSEDTHKNQEGCDVARGDSGPELLDFADVLKLLRSEISSAGSQTEWARQKSLDRVSVSYVLNERRLPSPRLLKALGLRKVVAYTQCSKVVL
jgi:hypothetical protein